MKPYETEYNTVKALCAELNIYATIDDGISDGTPGVFTVDVDGGASEISEALENKGFHVIEIDVDDKWLICEAEPRRISESKENEIKNIVRANSGNSLEKIGGAFFPAKIHEYGSLICICGETFCEVFTPHIENWRSEVVWTTTYKSVNWTDGGLPLEIQVFFRPTEEFVNGSDDDREHLSACGEQCEWEKPFIW